MLLQLEFKRVIQTGYSNGKYYYLKSEVYSLNSLKKKF
jgi:hypothetical protein